METILNRTFKSIALNNSNNTMIIDKEGSIDLCALRSDDVAVALYTNWMNDREVIKYLGRADRPTTIEQEKEWVARQINSNEITFNIVIKAGYEKIIGNCSLCIDNNNLHYGTLGILIGDSVYRNKNLGYLALFMLLDFAFNDKNLHTVALTVSEENIAAIKCYEKEGFKKQGIHRNTFYYEGTYHNAVYMDITKEEWERQKDLTLHIM